MVTKARDKKQRTVSLYVHLPEAIFELLRDVSLARHISGVAKKSLGIDEIDATKRKLAMDGIGHVVTDLVERHRRLLEDEAFKGGINNWKKSVSDATPEP